MTVASLFLLQNEALGRMKQKNENITAPRVESILTRVLCQALIIKKEVSAQRFADPAPAGQQASCPKDCHACCVRDVILDLTSVESLLIYLLNQDVVALLGTYLDLHEPSGDCPFLIMDKCIINTYKPSACQMYMPVTHQGRRVCFYLATSYPESQCQYPSYAACTSHSNAYAIHGVMLNVQRKLEPFFSQQCFKNIFDGTSWWEKHYQDLPEATRNALKSILNEDAEGVGRMADFAFEAVLSEGLSTYNKSIEQLQHS